MTKPIEDQVAEYMDYCEFVRQMSPMTLASKKSAYRQFIAESGCKDLQELTNREFNRWIKAQTAKGICPRTINMRIANLLAMFRYHREMGMNMPIKLPLIQKLKEGPARRVYYTREEIAVVLEQADNEMDWLLIRIAFDTGLRISELRNLSLESFDQRDPKHIVFIGKGFKPREVYITDETLDRLQIWISDAGVTNYIWLNEYNRHMGTDEIRIRMRKVFEKAGFDNFYPHALRHSFGTDIQRQGATILEMQKMLGHSNAETTERYIHNLDSGLGNLFEKYREKKMAA